ncbi:hypothetical protein QWY93_19445 [Echinicola jeungdonensis]|uniref:hypothetical protein n=1 Tax=Echinicola jeungdonensis TaxID=709343 RepID=UPI0025B3C133|nr:hypothetical protein [Echinicola jeungdonensis]MDN3671430.1 hypothetical protein [Echinicola jeungdonensis]
MYPFENIHGKTYPDFRTDFPAGCRPDLCHQCQQKVLYLQRHIHRFPKKGPKPHNKAEKILSAEVSKQRATAMEGAFGNHKNHYGLVKIRVKEIKGKSWPCCSALWQPTP